MSDSSPWLRLQQDTKPVLENVVLRRLRSVEGRVVDAHGEPVVGATVRQSGDGPVPTETETDADGQFRLPGVLAEPAFVFVEKKGYRFAGRSIGADSAPVDLTLERADGPPARPLQTLPPAISRLQEQKLLGTWFQALCRKCSQGPERQRAI